ncbi:hypothetical protein AB6V46_08655, partial [Stenotrophomonas maltophilia]
MIRGISDRYWTEHTGVRTGDDGMTTFWDEQNKTSSELEDLFNDGGAGASSADATSESNADSQSMPVEEKPAE